MDESEVLTHLEMLFNVSAARLNAATSALQTATAAYNEAVDENNEALEYHRALAKVVSMKRESQGIITGH